jgi:hypothetical protein
MRALITSLFVLVSVFSSAQAPPVAKPEDVKSIDSIIATLYAVISGAAGETHDWDRMRSLFTADARMIAVVRSRTGEIRSRGFTVDEYVKGSGPYIEKNGFFEREVSHKTEQFANIAHVFSTYESRHKADDKKPFERGINSFQLMNDGKRWWVVTVYWQGEDDKNPLPAKYLGG